MRERQKIIPETSATLNYLSEHFYEEGICDKIEKVLYEMARITK